MAEDLQGKVVIITGANSGIGKETAKILAGRGAHVLMACRNAQRGQEAYEEIFQSTGSHELEVMTLDLASFDSIREFAAQCREKYEKIDVLINNAGLFPLKKQMTEDGFEMQIGVNHLGHFLLTTLLLPQLEKGNARVINVASTMHNFGKMDFDSFTGEKSYQPMRAYGQSKLANVLFSRELARRYSDKGITSFSAHPGAVGTNIAGRSLLNRWGYRIMGAFLSPARGAKTSVYLATEPGIEEHNGGYFNEFCNLKPGSKLSQDMDVAEKLWEESERLVSGV